MKRVMNLAATAAFAGVMMTGCGSSKKLSSETGATEVVIPLSGKEFRTDKDFFRTSQLGKSPDLATAKKIALQNAKAELAGNIQSTVKAVTENYTNQRGVSDAQEFENKFEENARAVVNQSLNDVKIIGEKTFKEKDGKFTYYIAIEMSKESVADKVADRISKDAKLQLDFDKHQFQKVFDEEMKKFENQ
jgi:predicted transcriptional regulator YdeE